MYKISVPVMNTSVDRQGREKLLEGMKRLGAERVFCAQATGCCRSPLKEKELEALKKNCEYFKKEGFEVGAWMWTFQLNDSEGFTHMRAPDGKESQTLICPLDENYVELQGTFIAECAKTGIDLIMFDDDFRYGFQDMGLGCTCEKHLALMEKELGEKIDPTCLKDYLYAGGKNKYRDAFIKANGIALEYFAKRMREYVDSADENVRLGFCSCITSWDMDGTTPDRLARIMAGKTKPFYRLIGAPYWAALKAWGNRLQDVIDFERFECSRNFDKDIEIFSEGDVYPRPRYRVPSAYMEGFDTALRAAGCTHGILKYGLDYSMKAGIEDGYIKAAEHNAEAYKKIQQIFGNKNTTGIRLYVKPEKYAFTEIPERIAGTDGIQHISFTRSARVFSANGIPLTFEGEDVTGAAFGEDVNAVPAAAFENGLIIDAAAAKLLAEKGIDTGVADFGGEVQTVTERFFAPDTVVPLDGGTWVRKLTLKDGCAVESVFETPDGDLPASFRYKNADGQKFLVFAFDGYFANESLYRQYTRSMQITNAAQWLCGKKLPAHLYGEPDVYVMTKENENKKAVGVWNFSVDTLFDPVLPLDGSYEITDTLNCTAEIRDDKLYLSDIPPFALAAVEMK